MVKEFYWVGIKDGEFGKHFFDGLLTYSCGHKKSHPNHWSLSLSYPCYNCRQKMVGSRHRVVRYGDIPSGGKSFNNRDNRYELGVSCYLIGQKTRPEFTDGRTKLEFTAIIVGWGGDEEPLIDADTIKYE